MEPKDYDTIARHLHTDVDTVKKIEQDASDFRDKNLPDTKPALEVETIPSPISRLPIKSTLLDTRQREIPDGFVTEDTRPHEEIYDREGDIKNEPPEIYIELAQHLDKPLNPSKHGSEKIVEFLRTEPDNLYVIYANRAQDKIVEAIRLVRRAGNITEGHPTVERFARIEPGFVASCITVVANDINFTIPHRTQSGEMRQTALTKETPREIVGALADVELRLMLKTYDRIKNTGYYTPEQQHVLDIYESKIKTELDNRSRKIPSTTTSQ